MLPVWRERYLADRNARMAARDAHGRPTQAMVSAVEDSAGTQAEPPQA